MRSKRVKFGIRTSVPVSVIQGQAAGMTSGQWLQLPAAAGILAALTDPTGFWLIAEMNDIGFDPVRRKAHLVAKRQGSPGFFYRHSYYDEFAHAWTAVGNVLDSPGHGYDGQAIHPTTGQIAWVPYFQSRIWLQNADDLGNWSQTTDWPVAPDGNPAPGFTCWYGTLTGVTAGAYIVFTGAHLSIYDIAAAGWDTTLTVSGGITSYTMVANYQPNGNFMLFGGGNSQPRKLWRLNSDLSIDAMTDAPVNFGVQVPAAGVNGYFIPDPLSSKFILVNSAGTTYELDPNGNGGLGTWTLLPNAPVNVYSSSRASVFWPDPNNGVIVNANIGSAGQTPTMYLYKF